MSAAVSPSKISVVVCTRNRPDLLERCLERLGHLDPAPVEILVVDQSDTGASEEVIRRHAERIGNLHSIHDSGRGLSRARNRGIQAATGDILAFTDDDCLARSDWVGNLAKAFAANLDVAAVTGGSLPEETSCVDPRIIAATTWHPTSPRLFRSPVDPATVGGGFNLAFRRKWAEQVGGFDPDLGPGGRFRGADDTDFIHRLLVAGGAVLYDPAVVVAHLPWRDGSVQSAVEWEYGHGIAVWALKRLGRLDLFPTRVALRVFVSQGRRAVGGMLRRDRAALRTGGSYVAGMCQGAVSWLVSGRRPKAVNGTAEAAPRG